MFSLLVLGIDTHAQTLRSRQRSASKGRALVPLPLLRPVSDLCYRFVLTTIVMSDSDLLMAQFPLD